MLIALFLFVACDAQSYDKGTPTSVTPAPSPRAATPMLAMPAQAASSPTPTATPSAEPTVQSTPTQLPQTQTQTPEDTGPASTPSPTATPEYVVNGTGNSNVEQAHQLLQDQGELVYLVIVSGQSTGTEGEIYRDLRQRGFRSTTGPDEGVDTHGEFCYPACVFVLAGAVNAISPDSWVRVLQHEYRHITQAMNNADLAEDFRDPSGIFTTYAAFSEACADYGLNVAPIYRAQPRMDRLKGVLGTDQQGLIDQACRGEKPAYQTLVDQYNQKVGQSNAFQQLFPPYR